MSPAAPPMTFPRAPVALAAARIGRAATAALYRELALAPKPGLVSFADAGSHVDMDSTTFLRSIGSLRGYFRQIAALGAVQAPFAALERLGIQAEAAMSMATGGVNTHRGAIFMLGLLCAAAGAAQARTLDQGGERVGQREDATSAAIREITVPAVPARAAEQGGEAVSSAIDARHLRALLVDLWGAALARRACERRARSPSDTASFRTESASPVIGAEQHRVGAMLRDAGGEAALGFPIVFEVAWPALQRARLAGLSDVRARLQALFETIAVLDDTNLVRRGGRVGLRYAQREAAGFLHRGGAARPQALAHARAIHAEFVRRRLSPGGAADVLAAADLVETLSAPIGAAAIGPTPSAFRSEPPRMGLSTPARSPPVRVAQPAAPPVALVPPAAVPPMRDPTPRAPPSSSR